MTKKIVLLTPMLQPYRLTFYKKLSEVYSNNSLKVLYGISIKEDGKIKYSGKTDFISKGFPEYKLRIFPFEIVFNPGMYSEVKNINPDIIIMLASAGNVTYRQILSWAFRKKKRVIIWTSGWEPGRAKGFLLKFKNMLVAEFFKKADFFLTYSTYATKYVKKMGIDVSKIEVCFNGIETDVLERESIHTQMKAKEVRSRYKLANYITFVFVGGLLPEKRVDLLIDAFHILRLRHNKIKLFIIGDGPLRDKVEERLRVLNDPNIFYLGRIVEDIDTYIAASDCLVLPGAGGLALNQAMFWGKPCIASKADGTEDDLVISNVSGYRFKENDLSSLIRAMEERIEEDPLIVNRLSENAKHIIKSKSNVDNMVSVFSSTINRLV